MKLSRKSIIQIKRTSLFLLAFFLFMTASISSYAQDSPAEPITEIVFVLDCSQSMQEVDGEYASMEFIREFAASAPYNCRVGLAAYHNEVAASLPAGSSYEEIVGALSQLEYRYYGNAGTGMQGNLHTAHPFFFSFYCVCILQLEKGQFLKGSCSTLAFQ